jgi:hypothetical protein
MLLIFFLSQAFTFPSLSRSQDYSIDYSVPCDWYYMQRKLFESSNLPYPDDLPRCAPIKLTAEHKIVYNSNLRCQYSVDFVFRYRVTTWGELKHYKGLNEYSIKAPPPTQIIYEMGSTPNMMGETYEIIEVGCTVKYFEDCDKVREKRQFGIGQVYESAPVDKYPVFDFEISFPPDTELGSDMNNIHFSPHFIEFMPPGHPNHLALMGPFLDLDFFNSGDFVLLPEMLINAIVVGYFKDSIDWSYKGEFQGGDGIEEVKNNLTYTIEFPEAPDIY